jgi:hypothetical protein
LRPSSFIVQRSRRICFTQTNVMRPGLMMVKSHREPDFGWYRQTSPRFSAMGVASFCALRGGRPRVMGRFFRFLSYSFP